MKAIHLVRHGRPSQACECVDVSDVGDPADNEVVVEIGAAAINPADLLIMEDRYPGPAELPALIGIEGAGTVIATGASVRDLKPGDIVISMGRANWAERIKAKAGQFLKVPAGLDLRDAAMLKANPLSAHLMLAKFVDLAPGDWVIQNAANSAVGRHVIGLANASGINTINVVRRPALIEELKAHGGTIVIVDGDDLALQVRAETGGELPVRLAIDAVGGSATMRLADCLSDAGTIVNYGFLSGDPCMIRSDQAILRDIRLRGFWLVPFMRSAPRAEIEVLYRKMAEHFIDGTLAVPIEAEYGLEQIGAALDHASREGRGGKILLRPQA